MTKSLAFILATLLAVPIASATNGTCKLDTGAACTSVAPPAIATPGGMGQYCSVTYAGGGWGFTSATNLTGDPCASAGSGATIAHAGLYSVSGTNYVVERCTDGRIGTWRDVGNAPLTDAYNDAVNFHHPGCTFAVTPAALPVFASPFSLSTLPTDYAHVTGFDFARFPYYQIDLLDDWQESGARDQSFILDFEGNQRDGATATTIGAASNGATLPVATLHVSSTSGFPTTGSLEVATVDNGAAVLTYTGKTATTFTGIATTSAGELAQGDIVVAPFGFVDDHQGHDFLMDEDTPIFAVADGVVDMQRFRSVAQGPESCSENGNQGEIYIRHRISGGIATYDEVFESYYAHFHTTVVKTGDIVKKGQLIGHSGHSGCTGGANHLHMSVFRLTNTASARSFPLIINTGFGAGDDFNSDLAYRQVVDPWGFSAPTSHAFDPWSYLAFDSTKSCYDSQRGSVPCDWGALSTKLWESGQQPPLTPFADPVVW